MRIYGQNIIEDESVFVNALGFKMISGKMLIYLRNVLYQYNGDNVVSDS